MRATPNEGKVEIWCLPSQEEEKPPEDRQIGIYATAICFPVPIGADSLVVKKW